MTLNGPDCGAKGIKKVILTQTHGHTDIARIGWMRVSGRETPTLRKCQNNYYKDLNREVAYCI